MRTSRETRRIRSGEKRRGWEDWQRYVQKETQRLIKRSGRQVVEVSFGESEPPPAPPMLEPTHEATESASEAHAGRRPPVPGVPREEALQVSDDEIGRTVKPFTVQDYRNIRPLTSSELFEPEPASAPEEPPEEVPEPAVPEEPEPPDGKAGEPHIAVADVPSGTPDGQKKPAKRGGRKKKKERSEEPGLFAEDASELQTLNWRHLRKRAKLEREELIEKLLDPVISLEEAATLIGVCKTTVRRYTNRGELECLRTPGQQRRFKLSQVLAFVKKREEEEKTRRGKKRKGK
jgi:excisionase family DNA binding protein